MVARAKGAVKRAGIREACAFRGLRNRAAARRQAFLRAAQPQGVQGVQGVQSSVQSSVLGVQGVQREACKVCKAACRVCKAPCKAC